MHKKGDIVLIPFPFTDLSSNKVRPALVIGIDQDDCVVLFITSLKPISKNNTVHIEKKESEKIGLKKESWVIVSKIATLNKKIVLGKIGSIDKGIKGAVERELKSFLEL